LEKIPILGIWTDSTEKAGSLSLEGRIEVFEFEPERDFARKSGRNGEPAQSGIQGDNYAAGWVQGIAALDKHFVRRHGAVAIVVVVAVAEKQPIFGAQVTGKLQWCGLHLTNKSRNRKRQK
jgi:hypothetical protein